jgi:hypothetical protein
MWTKMEIPKNLPIDLPQDHVAELLQKARIKQAGTSHDPVSIRITVYCLAAKVVSFFRYAKKY